MTKEYLLLFNSITDVIELLQDFLMTQVQTERTAKLMMRTRPKKASKLLLSSLREDMYLIQEFQVFMMESQQQAEQLYLERTD